MKKSSADQPLIVTDGANVLCAPPRDTSNIAPCNHEEADSRVMVHVGDAAMQGFRKILVRTVDTDVVVLTVSNVQQLAQTKQIELWIAFGCGQDFTARVLRAPVQRYVVAPLAIKQQFICSYTPGHSVSR